MIISSKSLNYELYNSGLYGNKLRTWDSVDEFKKSNYNGSVSLRYKGKLPGQFTYYNVIDVDEKLKEIISKGGRKENVVINESAPDEFLVIQGELIRNELGLHIFYSMLKGKMRDCMKSAVSASGLTVKLLLQSHLTPSSYDDLMELLDKYPDHVIEFSTYSICLGDCVGRNTIIWEVRNY